MQHSIRTNRYKAVSKSEDSPLIVQDSDRSSEKQGSDTDAELLPAKHA